MPHFTDEGTAAPGKVTVEEAELHSKHNTGLGIRQAWVSHLAVMGTWASESIFLSLRFFFCK